MGDISLASAGGVVEWQFLTRNKLTRAIKTSNKVPRFWYWQKQVYIDVCYRDTMSVIDIREYPAASKVFQVAVRLNR